MKKYVGFLSLLLLQLMLICMPSIGQHTLVSHDGRVQNISQHSLSLAGKWLFQIDSMDIGIKDHWFTRDLKGQITLPGSMTSNNLGDDISLNTPWTGGIEDSSWFFKKQYAPYRKAGNIKVPFWLQPIKYYKGPAWYQKSFTIPVSWKAEHIVFFLERAHYQSSLWIDGQLIGNQNSLSTPHIYDLSDYLTPGKHSLTIRMDNRTDKLDVGINSHSVTDHTQGNWNGMIGKLLLSAEPKQFIEDVQIFPDIHKKQIQVQIRLVNGTGKMVPSMLDLQAFSLNSGNKGAMALHLQSKPINLQSDSTTLTFIYSMGGSPKLWDEFHPNLYRLKVRLSAIDPTQSKKISAIDEKSSVFGMREFSTRGTQFTINGRLTFLRGTLECAIFPLTGFPPTELAPWIRIFKIARSFGLNHMRFHSWCPPEAAFEAADQLGFYLQIECASWANYSTTIGDGKPIDQYIYDESNRIVKNYGNHPSFCMMAYGNEPAGKNLKNYLINFVRYWENKDPRRLYTTAAGWPIVEQNDYNSTPDPRIQAWGAGLNSIINKESPKTSYDWSSIISKWHHPTVSHEIGQWCAYPDFKEIKAYTGVMKAKNFEIFQDRLKANGMSSLADSFLMASGKLQALCYKADIEAALRTPGFGGFQLLDLHDFPGQGTALVGVLNAFWNNKDYISAEQYSRFCNEVVPLVRLPKMVYLNNERLQGTVEIANFGDHSLNRVNASWTISDHSGNVLIKSNLPYKTIPIGNGFSLGRIDQDLSMIKNASELTLSVSIGKYSNSWQIFVYPAKLPKIEGIRVVQHMDSATIQYLQLGGKVLLSLKKGDLRQQKGGKIPVGFSSIFWNTAWTHGQAPHTLGILCNPKNPALHDFPTNYYSSWQWWDAMSHSNAMLLDSIAPGLKPIVRIIDDWISARSLGLLFECRVGKGRLLVSSIDLCSDQDSRPEAKQLLFSLKNYMRSSQFHPEKEVKLEKILGLF